MYDIFTYLFGSNEKEIKMLNIRTITLSIVLVLTLVLGISPALASPAASNVNLFDVCNSATFSHPLGVEGGLLSLMDGSHSSNPNPVMEILRNEAYSVRIMHNGEASQIAYTKNSC